MCLYPVGVFESCNTIILWVMSPPSQGWIIIWELGRGDSVPDLIGRREYTGSWEWWESDDNFALGGEHKPLFEKCLFGIAPESFHTPFILPDVRLQHAVSDSSLFFAELTVGHLGWFNKTATGESESKHWNSWAAQNRRSSMQPTKTWLPVSEFAAAASFCVSLVPHRLGSFFLVCSRACRDAGNRKVYQVFLCLHQNQSWCGGDGSREAPAAETSPVNVASIAG